MTERRARDERRYLVETLPTTASPQNKRHGTQGHMRRGDKANTDRIRLQLLDKLLPGKRVMARRIRKPGKRGT